MTRPYADAPDDALEALSVALERRMKPFIDRLCVREPAFAALLKRALAVDDEIELRKLEGGGI